jgi:hypothetical protein
MKIKITGQQKSKNRFLMANNSIRISIFEERFKFEESTRINDQRLNEMWQDTANSSKK